MNSSLLSYSSPIGRWAGLGPYYAMFPVPFAFDIISHFSKVGDAVLDPFAGRASSVYAAAALGRSSLGIEINPVGWLYGRVKLYPANKEAVLARVTEVIVYINKYEKYSQELPDFFRHCFSPEVLKYLCVARSVLDWRNDAVDATLMALILVNLHGKRDQSLSNQMRQGKSMSPEYSINWWSEHRLSPPQVNPIQFLTERVAWRYKQGTPTLTVGHMILGDSTQILTELSSGKSIYTKKKYNLIFTSPPYYSLTNYHYDQWLRLWMLGGPERPVRITGQWQNRFESKSAYHTLLHNVFARSAELVTKKAKIYVRTDARSFTFETTHDALREAFPKKKLQIEARPLVKQSQTALFGDKSLKPGEIDIILS